MRTPTGKEAGVWMGVEPHQKPPLTSVADALTIFPRTARQGLLQFQEKTDNVQVGEKHFPLTLRHHRAQCLQPQRLYADYSVLASV